jgi:hypothetical protein
MQGRIEELHSFLGFLGRPKRSPYFLSFKKILVLFQKCFKLKQGGECRESNNC